MNNYMQNPLSGIAHPFPPVVDADSKALIVGSFPSVKSRETAFYYGHPQNRFWKLLGLLFSETVPQTVEDKIALLQKHHIALWDVVAHCEIIGSADSTLTPHALNDIAALVSKTNIRFVFANGKKAGTLYQTHILPQTGIPAVILPSTSPANAAWSLERLRTDWHPLYQALFEN